MFRFESSVFVPQYVVCRSLASFSQYRFLSNVLGSSKRVEFTLLLFFVPELKTTSFEKIVILVSMRNLKTHICGQSSSLCLLSRPWSRKLPAASLFLLSDPPILSKIIITKKNNNIKLVHNATSTSKTPLWWVKAWTLILNGRTPVLKFWFWRLTPA